MYQSTGFIQPGNVLHHFMRYGSSFSIIVKMFQRVFQEIKSLADRIHCVKIKQTAKGNEYLMVSLLLFRMFVCFF